MAAMLRKTRRRPLLLPALVVWLGICAGALDSGSIIYTISLTNPEAHLIHVRLQLPPGAAERDLQLPVWNARYVVRNFSQYVDWVRALDLSGNPLTLRSVEKSHWRVSGVAGGAEIEYEVFANVSGPYGAELNSAHAFLNLAEVLMYPVDARAAPVHLEFAGMPSGWKIGTVLAVSPAGEISAANYDELVDSPVELGTFAESDIEEGGGQYRVVVDADSADYDMGKVVSAVRRIVAAETAWMEDHPFKSYLFLFHFPRTGPRGGMEHSNCTAIDIPVQSMKEGPLELAGVTAHEFFHLWNVKRIRPQSLEPIDYTKANYTPALWFSEGVDSTVAGYIHVRAGLLDEKHYLNHLAREITEVEDRPAHSTQSAEQSSIDAWLEKYPYYNLPERSISYYNKGELLGVMLDLKMREASDDKVSLQDLFRWMNDHYAKQGKLFPDSAGVRDAAETLTHADFGEFFRKYVSGLDEIPWDGVFSRVGLRVMSVDVVFTDPGFDAERNFDQPPTVVQVEGGSGADESGLTAGDVIIQINGKSAGSDYEKVINDLGPGALLRLRILRNGSQHDLEWKLASRKQRVFQLEDVPGITAQQRSRRAAWLFGETAGFSASKQ